MIVEIRGNGKVETVTTQVHESLFCKWTQTLSPRALEDIRDTLNEFINGEGRDEIIISSQICGGDWDWTLTPYQPIYESVGRDWEAARFFLGLIVWRVLMDRPETWALERYPRLMGDVIDLTYFRVSVKLYNPEANAHSAELLAHMKNMTC